jgi:hypothetical protein
MQRQDGGDQRPGDKNTGARLLGRTVGKGQQGQERLTGKLRLDSRRGQQGWCWQDRKETTRRSKYDSKDRIAGTRNLGRNTVETGYLVHDSRCDNGTRQPGHVSLDRSFWTGQGGQDSQDMRTRTKQQG